MQIPASPDETKTTDVLHNLSRKKPRNLTSNGSRTHAPPRADNGSWNSHTRRCRFSTPRLDLSQTRHQEGLVVHRSTWPENLVIIRRRTRLHAPPRFLASPSRVGGLSTCLPRVETLLLTSPDDVINTRQPPRKHVHISKSHVNPRHVIRHVS